MKKTRLKVICGVRVVDVVMSKEGIGISFENGIILVIYNRFELEGFDLSDASLLRGNEIADVDEDSNVITIRFKNNWALRIDMRDEAYTGPEAMQLRIPGEPIVIWS